MNISVSKIYVINSFRITRSYSSYTKSGITAALNLSFNICSSRPSQEPPIIIFHGLFGSKYSWASIAKALSDRLARDVYTVDLRNHGDSPRTTEHTYAAMTEDIKLFIDKHQLKQPILLGHSMGGKLAMSTTLKYPHLFSKLIIVDMPPVRTDIAQNLVNHIAGMKAIENANVCKRSKADQILSKYEPKERMRTYLLENLEHMPDGIWRFSIPYETLGKLLTDMQLFYLPYENATYQKRTLYIGGEKSIFLPSFYENEKRIKKIFPNLEFRVVNDVGHFGKLLL